MGIGDPNEDANGNSCRKMRCCCDFIVKSLFYFKGCIFSSLVHANLLHTLT